ncbi:energy-coupling factor transporter transmembrane protein EcfT [bacterium]|nr:energy-coupling factor transporter transmembrane protein EcfT [candidate division CSSED10-310 bacterium]
MKAFIYNPENSPAHRLNPVTKIISLSVVFTVSMLFNHPLYLGCLIALVACLGTVSRSLPAMWKIKYLLLILFLFPTCLWSIYMDGTPVLLHWGPLQISSRGLNYGIAMGFRLTGMLMAGLILLATTRVEDFTAGLNRLGIPYRMSFSLTLAFRLVPLFYDTFQTVVQAQQSRGFILNTGNILQKIRRTLPVLIPVFVSGIRRTDQLAVALESKGFGYRRERTRLHPIRFSRSDRLLLSAAVLFLCVCIILRLTGQGKL